MCGQFSGPKWPGNGNPSDEKACRLAHFEALELSYPKITFPCTFWKPPNPEFQVQIFEILTKTSRILGPTSNFSDPNFGFSGTRFGSPKSDFRKKVLREPSSKCRKFKVSESVQINWNRSKELENDLDSRFRGVEGRFDPKFHPERSFCTNRYHSLCSALAHKPPWTQVIPEFLWLQARI